MISNLFVRSVAVLAVTSFSAATGPAASGAADQVEGRPAVSPVASSEGSLFVPVTPVRVLDTRPSNPAGRGGTILLDLSSRVPDTTTAVMLNVTGVGATAPTFVTVYPSGTPRPAVSNLNLVAGQTRPNAVTVAVSPDRHVNLFNNAGQTHLVVDLNGYYVRTTEGAGFEPRLPLRALDTRRAGGPVGPGGVVTIDSGLRGESVRAVTVTLTGIAGSRGTFVTAWPDGSPRPTASVLNLAPGEVATNQVTVAVGANGRVNLYNNDGNTDLVVDMHGVYYQASGLRFFPVTPQRIWDTRPGGGLGQGEDTYMEVLPAVPDDAAVAVFNLTGTNTTASTFVTVWQTWYGLKLLPRPDSSNLNLAPGQTAGNLVTVYLHHLWPVARVYNNAGYVDLIADLAGYFAV